MECNLKSRANECTYYGTWVSGGGGAAGTDIACGLHLATSDATLEERESDVEVRYDVL